MTIGGQSAGSASAHYLILSPLGKGLFKRAILQSGTALNPWSFTDTAHERAFMLARALNYETNSTEKLIRKSIMINCEIYEESRDASLVLFVTFTQNFSTRAHRKRLLTLHRRL